MDEIARISRNEEENHPPSERGDGQSEMINDAAKSESIRVQLEAYQSDYFHLTLKLIQLTESSAEWSDAKSQLEKLRGEIDSLENQLARDSELFDSAHRATISSGVTEPETVTTGHSPMPVGEMAAVFEDKNSVAEKLKNNQQHPIAASTHAMHQINENVAVSNQRQVQIQNDEESVGGTTITTRPPSMININEQSDEFLENEDLRISEVSAVYDPSLDTLHSMPILRATLVTESDTHEQQPIGPVYDAVEVSDEPLPFLKRHKMLIPLLLIICILIGSIIGIVLGMQKDSNDRDSTELSSSLNSPSPSSSVQTSASSQPGPSPSSKPPSSSSNAQMSQVSQSTPCDTYRVVSQGTIVDKSCKFCYPLLNTDENTTTIIRQFSGKIDFYQSSANYSFEQHAPLNLNLTQSPYIWSVAISGDVAVAGDAEYNNYTGAAYVFEKNISGTWNKVMQIEPQNITAAAWYGYSVDVHHDLIAIGAPDYPGGGSTFIYRRDNGNWTLDAMLANNHSESGMHGESVSLKNNVVVVGDYLTGDSEEGIVFVYKHDLLSEEPNQLTDKINNTDCAKYLGFAVELTDDLDLLVSCAEDSDGYEAVYYYQPSEKSGHYEMQQKISVPDDRSLNNTFGYGYSIVADGNIMLLGTYSEDEDDGEVHVFTKDEYNVWAEVAKISAPDNVNYFGQSYTISGRKVLVSSESKVHSFYLEDC